MTSEPSRGESIALAFPEILLVLGFMTLSIWRPESSPWVVLPGLIATPRALLRGAASLKGTELNGALAWACLTVLLATAGQFIAIPEPLATGRPITGHFCYLATLGALATLISVLNARTPGGGAWAILMGLLSLVFLIPWLEGAGLRGGVAVLGRLQLESPWTLFYGLLVLAGATNFLPTRFGLSACWLILGFVLQYLALTGWVESRSAKGWVWSAVPWTFTLAVFAAARREARPSPGRCELERLWFWFRDHWGVVWGLRILERFNKTAEAQGWTLRLSWQGLQRGEELGESSDAAALALLKGLLRRFARPDRLEKAAQSGR